MTQSTSFHSLMTDSHHEAFPAIARMGIRTWLPGSNSSRVPVQNTCGLYIVINGILVCEQNDCLERVLPREIIRFDGNSELSMQNLSHVDPLTVLEIELQRHANLAPLLFHRYYCSDDRKNNELCLIASKNGAKDVLGIDAKLEIYLCTLQRWDTVLLESPANTYILVAAMRGVVTVGEISLDSASLAHLDNTSVVTITGAQSSEILAIREAPSQE